jgi:diguanylate cyclase (GGDEF)-like protein
MGQRFKKEIRETIEACEPPRPIPRQRWTGDNFLLSFSGSGAIALSTLRTWSSATLKTLVMPGAILLLGVAVLVYFGWLTLAPQALIFLYYCALGGGLLLAWRFHSSRAFFALLVLFLAQQATALLGSAHAVPGTPGLIALEAVAFLVPLDFAAIALMQERGFIVSATAPLALFLFVQSVIVAVLCRAAEDSPSLPLRGHHAAAPAASWPEYVWFMIAAAGLFLLVRSLLTRKPVDAALFWSLCAFCLSLHFIGTARMSIAYAAAASVILAISIIETSYLLAYHDELTSLPSRRAFNDALLRLQDPFVIAAVDIDHFKRFNDTYGHDTGDQVLRLVAGNLASVTGGGEAYRCGGEEFTILFPGKTLPEVMDHVERLREKIESSQFHLRSEDRRQNSRGNVGQERVGGDQVARDQDRRNRDRRNLRVRKRGRTGDAIRQLAHSQPDMPLSVTVSIGVAASTSNKPYPDTVMEAADKALYRAKANGRNRVETAASVKRRNPVKASGIA